MSYGRLFPAGDAAHTVPPTGARGLNTAASDVYYLYRAMLTHYQSGDDSGLKTYSQTALARVWKAQRFSWWMTMLLHPDRLEYEGRLQQTEMSYLFSLDMALRLLARELCGIAVLTDPRLQIGMMGRFYGV